MGCHCLLRCMQVKSESEVAQSCPTSSDPMDCSLPGSSIQGIFQTRVLEWVAIAFSSLETTRGLMQWWVGGECGGEFLGEDLGKSHLARSQNSAFSWKALMPANSGCCHGFWVQTQPPLLSSGVTWAGPFAHQAQLPQVSIGIPAYTPWHPQWLRW